jgi:hypothetical protein
MKIKQLSETTAGAVASVAMPLGSTHKRTEEAANPAQQAAIAVNMKKTGKKPKKVDEGTYKGPHGEMDVDRSKKGVTKVSRKDYEASYPNVANVGKDVSDYDLNLHPNKPHISLSKVKKIKEGDTEPQFVEINPNSFLDDDFYAFDPETKVLKGTWSHKSVGRRHHEYEAQQKGYEVVSGMKAKRLGLVRKQKQVDEGGFDIPEIPRAPTPKPPKEKDVAEGAGRSFLEIVDDFLVDYSGSQSGDTYSWTDGKKVIEVEMDPSDNGTVYWALGIAGRTGKTNWVESGSDNPKDALRVVKNFAKNSLAEGMFGLSDKEKGKIQNIAIEISDIPGYWDWKRDTFTPYGVLALEKALDDNKHYVKYALSLTADDYYYDLEEGKDESLRKAVTDFDYNKNNQQPVAPSPEQKAQIKKDVSDYNKEKEEKQKQGVKEDWQKVNRKDKTSGMSSKAVKAYRRENPGSKLKTAVTTKPSKLKRGSKAAKRRKSFCARMSGNKGPMKKPNGKPTPKALALRRWNCESIEDMRKLIENAEKFIAEHKQINNEKSLSENLHKWFKEKWVRFGPDGKIRGDCARGDDSEGKPKCLPQSKAQNLGKKGRASAAARKRREDPNPERSGKAINVATKKKTNEADLNEACWKGYHKEGNKKMFGKTYPNCVKNTNEEQQLDEKCWDTHKQVGMKKKGGKMVPNCVPKESIQEGHQQCPECGGAMYSEEMINEKKDACYYKVKSRYKVWPSAYASGALVKCRKKGAKNWGTKSESIDTKSNILKGMAEAKLREEELLLAPGQGVRFKTELMPKRTDHEVEMARNQLRSSFENAKDIYQNIKDLSEIQGLDGWVQAKITKASDYLEAVNQYIEGKKEMLEIQSEVDHQVEEQYPAQQYSPKGVPLKRAPVAPTNVPQGWQANTQADGSTRISKQGSMSRDQYQQNMANYKAQNWTPQNIADYDRRMASGQGYSDAEKYANYQAGVKASGREDPETLAMLIPDENVRNQLQQPTNENNTDFDDRSPQDTYIQSKTSLTSRDGVDDISKRVASLSTDRHGNQRVRAIDTNRDLGDEVTINTMIPKGVKAKIVPQQGNANIEEAEKLSAREKFKRGLKRAGYDPDAGADRLLRLIARQAEERKEFERKQKEQDEEFYKNRKLKEQDPQPNSNQQDQPKSNKLFDVLKSIGDVALPVGRAIYGMQGRDVPADIKSDVKTMIRNKVTGEPNK